MKCLACGSESLVGGIIYDSNGSNLNFMLDEAPVWKSLLGVGTRGIRASGCVHCRQLQLAVDFTEKDLQKYQQFEGLQPGILERINSDDVD